MAKKGKPLDWEAVLAYDVGQFKPNDPESEARLEELLSETTNVYISDKDPKTTVSNLIKLVQICQLQLELKNDDLDDAEEHIKDLENEVSALKQSAGGDSSALGAPDSRALRDDIADLTKRNDALIRDLSRAEESLDSERKAVQQLTMSLREEKTRSMKSEDTIERLTKELHDCRDQLGTQRSRLQSKTIDEDHFRTQIKDKNSEITKYIHEIQALGAHNVKLSNEVEMMAQELEATVIELERNAKEQEEAQNLIMENDKLIDSLQSEREAMKIKLEELSDQLHRRAVKDDRLINQFQGELSRFRSSWEESQQGLVEKESLIDQLKLEIRQLREELADNDAHQLRKQLNEKDEEIQALHQKLEQSYKDFELLSLDWDEIDRVLQQQTVPQKDRPRTPSLQSHHATDLQSKMEGLKQIRTRDLATISKLQEQVEEQERELVDMRARMDIYEQGHYGMREAMREVKTLKLQKNIRDKEIADLTSKVNDLTAQAEDFYEENQQLRARLGTKEKTKIDVSNLKLEKDIELEQTRALNSTLQNEISRLEEERLALKSQLRLQALERGERAVALGLRAEDLEAVEEYAMNLRHGTGAAPAEGKAPIRPVINNEQLEKLAIELERVHVEAYEARQQITSMEDEVARLSRENRSLEDAVKEISETLVKTRNGTRINGHTGADVGSNIEFPLVQNLIYLLEKKIRRELGHGLETLDEASDSIVDMNRTLREELYSTRANLSDVRTKLQQRESDLEQATLDLSYWKERAQCPRQRVLDLPAELGLGTIHDYSAVVEQLIECLLDLKTKDRELDEARQDIAKFEKSYSVLVGKQRLLYRDFHEQREQWRSEAKSLKEKLQGSETEQECLSLKLREMDRLVDSLSKDPESVRADLIEAQRKVSVLSVNEHNLKRRYSAMLEVESILRKESSSLKNEIFRLEKVSRETIMRLYQSKKELQAQAQHLEKELADSVRLSDFLQLQNTMELYKTKTKLLLDKERDWITDRDRRESDSRKVSHQREQIEQLKQKLAETAAKANSLDITVHQIKERSSAGKKELAELMHKIASLEVERDLLKSRAELAEGKCKAIEGARDEMSKRLSTVEALYMDCTEDCLRAKEAEINTRNAFEGGATKEEHEESQRTIRELREKSEHLSRELDQAKEATEMAIRQTTDYAHLHKMDQKEKDIYRATIRELQMCDDDKLVIGKLHHHILALQMSEALAKQRLEAEKDKVIKLESQVLALEKALDEQEKMIYQIRKDERSKCRYLNKCITDFRIKLAGVVLLERHERACESLRSVDHHKRELEQECKSYREVKKDMEDKIIELEMTLSAKGELFETLKHATRMNERIQAWHSKMTRLQISELQKQREIDRLIVERAAASQENAELGSRVAALEEELVGLQSKLDLREVEWDFTVTELEKKIQHYEDERDHIYQAATSLELKKVLPNANLPIAQQLETALRLLIERSRIISAQDMRISNLEAKIHTLNAELKESTSSIRRRDEDIVALKYRVAKREEIPAPDLEISQRTNTILVSREKESLRAAQEFVESLQRQLAKKESIAVKYQAMLESTRSDFAAQRERDRQTIISLTETINEMNDREVSRLKQPSDLSLLDVAQRSADSEAVTELEKSIQSKECELDQLRRECASLHNQLEKTKDRQEERSRELAEETEHWRREAADGKQQIEELAAEMDSLRTERIHAMEELENSNSELRHQIELLHKDLAAGKAKEKALKQAIMKFRNAMPQAPEVHKAVARSRESRSSHEADGPDPLKSKMMTLETKIGRMARAAEEHHRQQTEHEMELKVKSCEIAKKAQDIARLQDEVKKSKKLTADLEARLKKAEDSQRLLQSELNVAKSNGALSLASTANIAANNDTTPAVSQMSIYQDRGEPEKKLKRQVESLKAKLASKENEAKDLVGQVGQLKDGLTRVEREHAKLLQKLQNSTSGKAHSATKEAQGRDKNRDPLQSLAEEEYEYTISKLQRQHADQVKMLKDKIWSLETELEKWREEIDLTKSREIAELRSTVHRLTDQIEVLEKLKEAQEAPPRAFARSPEPGSMHVEARVGNRSAELVEVLDSRIRDLLKKNSDMQEENANLETRIKKLEYETAKCVRMKERAERQLGDTEMYLESLQEAERKRVEFEESRILPEINMPPSTLRSTAGKTVLAKKSVDELVDIIDHLSSATERLKLENDKYRRAGLSNAKYLELMKECKALKREKEIYSDFEKHKAKLEAHISKIEEENQKLRKQIRKENNRAAHHLQRIEELEQRNEMLQSQIQVLEKKPHRSNRADEDSASCSDAAESNASELIQELRSQLAERDRVVQNLLSTEGSKQEVVGLRDKVRKLMQELDTSKIRVSKLSEQIVLLQSTRGGGEKESTGQSAAYLAMLESENRSLKEQIARIPPGLVDDLEDLSFNYKESVRQNLQYEETIRSLCERIGLSPEHVLGIGGAGPSQW